jgi:[acyl-carrier-protein] S-malonyltransferase
MGLALAEGFAPARALLERAEALSGVPLARELERMGPAVARDTAVLQPCLLAVGLGALAWLAARGARPAWAAGHSLGDLAAWAAAGGAPYERAVELARARGVAMARAARAHPGGMLALTDADEDDARRVAAAAGAWVAAHNGPREWVLSGDARALRAASRGRPAAELPVAGAWHSDWMADAAREFGAALAGLACEDGATSAAWVSCVSARAEPTRAGAAGLLAEALVRPVRWVETLRELAARGATRFVIAGPGRALRASVRRVLGEGVCVLLADDAGSTEAALRALAG